MYQQHAFEICYRFNGELRQFQHQAQYLCESDALYIATLHAGVGQPGASVAAGPVRRAMQLAEGLGVTDLQWKRTC